MRPFAALFAIPFLCALTLRAQLPGASEVQERRLPNGIRLLLVERPGLPAFHATLAFRGGWSEEPTALAGATQLLARALYGATWPEDAAPADPRSTDLEALLKQEDGLSESLRLARLRPDGGGAAQTPELEASLQTVRERMSALRDPAPLTDLYARLGGAQSASAEADVLLADTELPVADVEFWCKTEAQRLERLQLSRFFEAREALLDSLQARRDSGLALLRGAAFPGHPYGRNLADHLAGVEALRWSDVQAYARQACTPDRLTVILVGGLRMDAVLPVLSKTLGALPAPPAREEPILPDLPADLGDRQIQAAVGTTPHLLVGWRIPPRNHPDHLALTLAARLLGGPTGRLATRLIQKKGIARRIDVALDQPGGRHGGLFTVEAWPAEGHSLAELTAALHSEILRFQEEVITPDEWNRALAGLEMEQLQDEDSPARLGRALARAWAEAGDWRAFYTESQRLSGLTPEAVQSAVQTWLQPSHRTTALLEPSARDGQDPLEAETLRTLQALAARRIEDPGQRERLVAEGLRQLRMLPVEERRRTLQLLLAQLPPVRK